LWQSLSFSADAAAMSTFFEGGLFAFTQIGGARRCAIAQALHATPIWIGTIDVSQAHAVLLAWRPSTRSNSSAWRVSEPAHVTPIQNHAVQGSINVLCGAEIATAYRADAHAASIARAMLLVTVRRSAFACTVEISAR
jgi:predicted metal-dependent enzyme (double-stranded beta helix superfamily)